MTKTRKQRQEDAAERQASYDALTVQQKISKARSQPGESRKVLDKLKKGAK